jgi:hypothetical protein
VRSALFGWWDSRRSRTIGRTSVKGACRTVTSQHRLIAHGGDITGADPRLAVLFRTRSSNGSAFLAYFWSTQIVTAEVELDIGRHRMLRTVGTEISQLRVSILEQSIAAAACAMTEEVMIDFMNYRVHGIFSSKIIEQFPCHRPLGYIYSQTSLRKPRSSEE